MSNPDPFERARAIRKGTLDCDMPNYEELKGWLQRVPKTWLPGLLTQCIFSCVAEECFRDGGLAEFVALAEADAKDPSHVLRVRRPATEDLLRELSHIVRLLEPIEEAGAMSIPGLATLNGARLAIAKAEGKD